MRAEVPWVDRSPAEIVRDHVRLTIQPFDAPADPDQVERVIEHLRSDAMLLYASDFPHWQFDGDETVPAGIPAGLHRKILVDNPLATYDRVGSVIAAGAFVRVRRHVDHAPCRSCLRSAHALKERRAMNIEVRQPRARRAKARVGIFDCDIHPKSSLEDLRPYLSNRWWDYLQTYGQRQRHGYVKGFPYPKSQPLASRRDSWPPGGGLPASDLDFMRQQHLDFYGIEWGVMNPLSPTGQGEQNDELSAAMAFAANEYQLEGWNRRDPRLQGLRRHSLREQRAVRARRSASARAIAASPMCCS